MKMIIAMVHPTKLDAIREALERIEVTRFTVANALGYVDIPDESGDGLQRRLAQRIELTIVVNDDFLERTLNIIKQVGRTRLGGHEGDGKILVLPALETIAIAEDKRGPSAV